MRGLIVTAHLPVGYCSSDPWSPALDGILAWAWMRRHHPDRLHEGATRGGAIVEADLPLGRVGHGTDWWWACASPRSEAAARVRRHYHRRFDDDLAGRHLDESVRKVSNAAGPYKSSRLSEIIVVTDRVSWQAEGDIEGVRDLLGLVPAIGRGTARGFGRVRRWTVEEGGEVALCRHDRPVPESYAAAHGLAGSPMLWTLRPPGHARPRQPCIMPVRS